MTNAIADKARAIMAEHLEKPIESLHDKADLRIDLGADSLDTVEIVIAFEDAFNISITDNDAEAMQTVSDTITTLEMLIHQQD